jgi:peroxiredoxin
LSPPEAGQLAPTIDFELQDADGKSWTIADALSRGPVLLGIYKSSCQASKAMLPMLDRLQKRYGEAGLTVLGIAQDSANITSSFARRYDINFPILIDTGDYAVSRAFDIFATPTVFLIRQDSTIAFTTMGFFKEQVNLLAASVAGELGLHAEPITLEEETDVPMFVPG